MLTRIPFLFRHCLFAVCFALPGTLYAYDNGIVPTNTPESARRMINDLIVSFGGQYPQGVDYLKRLDAIETKLQNDPQNVQANEELQTLIRDAALANPLLDFDKILCVRRKPGPWGSLGFTALNAYTNDTIPRLDWDNEIVVLSNLRGAVKETPIYRHPRNTIMRDLDLHFDGERLMFSSIDEQNAWAVYEINVDGSGLKKLSPDGAPDVDWFDACYLPEEGVILSCSNAGFQGLPCVNGNAKMANIYRIDNNNNVVRQLTYEQDSDWHPRVMNDGRIMYLRWEYTDTPHFFNRVLFSMMPDGRQQRALWGSGSYFPAAYKHPRAIPGHPSMILGVVSGHHSLPESGRMMLLDPNVGSAYPFRHDPETKEWGPEGTHLNIIPRIFPKEVTGCMQEIPGFGREVVGNVYDAQGGLSKYTYFAPYPLNENYYITSMWLDHQGTWGVWLVDRFDNMIKLYDLPDAGLFEVIPVVKRERPPVRPDSTIPGETEGTMFITDVYHGRGLPGIPRGTAKKLRIFSYHFCYYMTGGHEAVGQESTWDIKRVLGTVPIEADGSVCFKVPANTPISIQVLDENDQAIQIMQSWTVSMPSEQLSCVGCHENTRDVTPATMTIAAQKAPQEIQPWYGPPRPFGYETEVQPVLDRYCVGCHNDTNKAECGILSFVAHNTGNWRTDTSYQSLNPYLRRPGPEVEVETKTPMDYHASTSELIQRLRKGHHGVELDRESWDRLHTWIDLNVPYRGDWQSPDMEKRRLELQELYAGMDTNPEAEFRNTLAAKPRSPERMADVPPEKIKELLQPNKDDLWHTHWPFTWWTAKRYQGENSVMDVDLGNGQTIRFRKIPAGEFIMGSLDGYPDEFPRKIMRVEKPFWIAETELTNGQYGVFDPIHDTGYTKQNCKDHVSPGYIANHPNQPVARVSWQQAMEFCNWLSQKTGQKATLPTEAQWEWAARAGRDTRFYFGNHLADYSRFANLADASLRQTIHDFEDNPPEQFDRRYPENFVSQIGGSTIAIRRFFPVGHPFPLRDDRYNDGWYTVDYVKQHDANAWGLYDVIGNVWEWTRSDYAPYPYDENDGRNNGDITKKKVARGGSHCDRPSVVGASVRMPFESYQKVHNVGFRPIIEIEE